MKLTSGVYSMINPSPTRHGFSLVELSVVLAIIGVTLGGALTLATKKSEAAKINETQIKLDTIEHALEHYVMINQRLPCPADASSPVDASTDNQYGTQGQPTATACANRHANASKTIYSGVVPTKTLGLPDDSLIDGWGNRIRYAVDIRFANNRVSNTDCNGIASTDCFQYAPSGIITVLDAAGGNRTTEAVYVIMSHGKNGYGAFTYYGSNTPLAFPTSADSDEQKNSGDEAIFVQKSPDNTFDDMVRYKPKWQLVNDAGGITDPNICIPAQTAIDHPDVAEGDPENSCSGASSVTTCEILAAKIHTLCLQ